MATADRQTLDLRIAADEAESRRFAWTVFGVFIAAAATMWALAYLLVPGRLQHPLDIGMALLSALLVLVAFISPLVVIVLRRIRSRHSQLSQDEFELLDEATKGIGDKPLGQLISFNFRVMDRFVTLALAQAKTAYIFCAAASSAALLLLLAGATSVIAVDDVSARVTVTVLSGIGALMSSLIGATFIRTLKITSSHMEYYYGQPLVHCYLLHAEWLVERLGRDYQDIPIEFRELLIRDTLGASKAAQNQLNELLRPPARQWPSVRRARLDEIVEPNTDSGTANA